MISHFTATAVVINRKIKPYKTLLLWHGKQNCWLPPGGHVEDGESPCAAARREAREETGYELKFGKGENFFNDKKEGKMLFTPFCVLEENIKERKVIKEKLIKIEPAHKHIDFVYLTVVGKKTGEGEGRECRWFTRKDIKKLKNKDILKNVRKLLLQILK